MWTHWLGNQETLKNGGYYAIDINDKVTLISLNTNIYLPYDSYAPNFYDKADPAGQFAWLNQQVGIELCVL